MTNISIEKKTLATATLISSVAGLNSANFCKPSVCTTNQALKGRNQPKHGCHPCATKNLLWVLLLALLAPLAARAEQVTIGNLESASQFASLPFNGTYCYSYSQQIYTAEEIGTVGNINSLTVWLVHTGSEALPTFNIDIYMKEVDKETFTSTTDWVSVSTSDIVYSGTLNVTNTTVEAFTFTLDTPFEYTGQGNLLVAFDNNTGSWKSGLKGMVFGATGDPSRAIYAFSDSSNFDPLSMSGATAYTTYSQRSVIKFNITDPNATTLTVYDGTDINQYVPVYGYWADAYQKCEFVIPANQLTDMNGCPLSQMTFYLASPASEPWTGTFQVFLKEVNYTTLSAFSGTTGATVVYQGTLDGSQSTMTVDFDNNYTYGGGNLLVGVYETVKGNYKSSSFFGQNVEGACVQGYSSSSLNEVAANQRNFIPKTTFTYTVPPPDPCLIAVTPNAPYIEDFESPGGVPINWAVGPVPDCWGQYTTGPALPHITNQAASEGAQSLSFYHLGDSYAILPEFSTAINLLKISFWEEYGNGLQLGYITAADNGTCNTFTAIDTYYGGGSGWTQHVTYLSDVPETAHRLVFKWIGGGSSCFIDYVEVTFFDGCYNVGTLSTSDLTAHSVHLSWDLIDDSQTEWYVQVANNADFTENLVEHVADSHEDYLIDNLDGGTVYYVRVGPTCSEYWWSNTVVFATQCDGPITVTADAPYTQGFENECIPGCWDVYAPEGHDAPSVNNYFFSHSGSYSLMFMGTSYAVLPEFSNPLDELQISFWIEDFGQLQLGYITAEDDGTCNTFTAIADYNSLGDWVQYTNYLLNVPATAHRLAFKVISIDLYVDDVEIALLSLDCYPVGNLSLGRVASTSAYMSWEVYDAEQTAWDVQVATDANFTENVANHVANSHENYLVEGLDPDTYYYVRVKPTCSDDLWSNTVQFWTMPPCNGPITVTADAPYTEGFENPEGTNYNVLGRLPACWESYTTGTVGPHNTTAGSANVHGGSQSLSFNGESGTDTYYAILPEFSNPFNELQISFWMKDSWGRLQLGYLTAEDEGNCNTFTAIADFGAASTWTQRTVYLLNVPEAAQRLAFKFSESNMGRFIDDVEVSICTLDCFPVGALSVEGLSSTSAYLSWELFDDSQTAWNVQLATDAAFTNILVDEETDSHENYLLEGLSIGTYYYVRVKPTCTDDLWNDLDFALPCAPITVTTEAPYTQDFETPEGTTYDVPGPLPLCWETYKTGIGVSAHNSFSWSHGSTQSLAFYNQGSTFAVLPEFSNHLKQLQVSFWMKTDSNNGTLQLGYLTAEDDGTGSSFTSIVTYNNGNQIQQSTVLENVPAEAERLAFKWSATSMLYCYIDDVEVSINPAMIPPHDIAAVNITPHEADITWEGYCDSYALRYREVSLAPEPLLSEGFEGGTMPQGWTIEGANQDPAKTWRVGVGDYQTNTSTHSGNYNALITHNTSNQVTYLVMPALDLGEYGSAELSFWYINRKWGSDIDEFAVCYRIGNEGEWSELWNTAENHQTWTSQSVELTGFANNYQIGFRFTDHYGYGVGLDDIALSGVAITEWITISEAESLHTLTGLAPETTYEVQVQGTYGSTVFDWSDPVTFTTLEACPVPFNLAASDITPSEVAVSWTGYSDSYNLSYRRVPSTEPETILSEGFEGGTMPQGWTIEGANQDPAKTWRVGVGDYSTGTGTHSGSYNALITHNTNNQVTYLVTPAIDLGGYGSAELSFWYVNRIWSGDIDEFAICYRIGNEGEWNELWSTTASHATWTNQSVELTGLAENYQIGFRFTDHWGYGVGLDDIALSGVFSNPSWINLSEAESPQTIEGLRPEIEYEVKVQGVCDGEATEWSESAYFTTLEQTAVTQTVELVSGWNWVSFNVETTLEDLQAALVSTGNTSITIKSKSQNAYYQNGRWRGNLNFDVAMMYKIFVGSACEITLEGMPINPSEHSITIHNGPNWIGFPLRESMTLDNAFAGFAVNGDVIKYKGGSANYQGGRWRGAFNLQPGQGYIYNSNVEGDRTLTFPASAK